MDLLLWLINHIVVNLVGAGITWLGDWLIAVVEGGLSLDTLV